jgi:hypothetical protein
MAWLSPLQKTNSPSSQPATLDRLAHEYGLKDELKGAWAQDLEANLHQRRTKGIDSSAGSAAKSVAWAEKLLSEVARAGLKEEV